MVKKYIPGETKEQRKARKRLQKAQQDQVELTELRERPSMITGRTAFVCGNGTSRDSISLTEIRPHGRIYACNAVYRDFDPDYLIAVDTKMIREISSKNYHLKHGNVWTNPNKYTRSIPGLNLFNPNLGWSSGPTALHLASSHENDIVYILGFDYQGTGKKHEIVNNIFAGTPNYKNKNDRATYFGNWSRQTMTILRQNRRTKYIRVVEDKEFFLPDNLEGLENLSHITVKEFKKQFNLS